MPEERKRTPKDRSGEKPENTPRGPDRPGGPNNNGMGFRRGMLGWAILIGAAMLIVFVIQGQTNDRVTIPFSTFRGELALEEGQESNVRRIKVNGTEITGEFRDPVKGPESQSADVTRFRTEVSPGLAGDYELFREIMNSSGNSTAIEFENTSGWYVYVLPLIPWILISDLKLVRPTARWVGHLYSCPL